MARRLIVTCAVNCAGLLAAVALVPPFSYHHRWQTLVLAALILGVVNFVVRPLVIAMALPAVILSFGLALLLVNALMLWITSRIVAGLYLGDLWSTVGAALVISVVNLGLRACLRVARL